MDAKDQPSGAVIELVERHSEDRKPEAGPESFVLPNELRINGNPVYAAYDAPIVVHEVSVSGEPGSPFVVTVTVQCRELVFGDPDPGREVLPHGSGRMRASTVRVPLNGMESGDWDRPYVVLNGDKVWLAGQATMSEVTNGGGANWRVVEVTLPLLCRRLVVDDEPNIADLSVAQKRTSDTARRRAAAGH